MELENCKSIYKNYGEKLPDSTARNVCKAAPPKKQTKVYLEVSNEVSVFKETTIEQECFYCIRQKLIKKIYCRFQK